AGSGLAFHRNALQLCLSAATRGRSKFTMEKRRLGRTDMDVTVLGFGGAGIAGESMETIGNVLTSALDAGINVIDTVECYEGGEESIGNAISKRRDEFFLF